MKRISFFLAVCALSTCAAAQTTRPMSKREWNFSFDPAAPGDSTVVSPTAFDRSVGFGYETPYLPGSHQPAIFSVAVPEGTYRVTVTLGGAEASDTTIKAEARQLALHDVSVVAGQSLERSFLVNVRTPRIDASRRVSIKEREAAHYRWDDKLTLEINGAAPAIRRLTITPADGAHVVYLVGDSTVCDQATEPWNSWGQMLPAMLDLRNVAVANHAESGEAYSSFIAARRWEKVLSTLHAGDIVIMQMGHNDMKQKGDGAGAYLNYTDAMKRLVKETREHGATPILVTPVHRRAFNDDGTVKQTLGDYPEAVRKVAGAEKVDLIDLNEISGRLYQSFGKEGSAALFVDGTHHNNYGSYLLARCVAASLSMLEPEVAGIVRTDLPAFDPAHPPTKDDLHLPVSPQRDPTKPDGN